MRIEELRNRIKGIDEEILKLLAKRMEVVEEVFLVKKMEGRRIHDEEQERKVLSRAKGYAKMKNLPEDDVEKIFKLILKMSLKRQK
jgi:chorismate mutase